jgi:dTDP-4-dehydrorhamnose reductase
VIIVTGASGYLGRQVARSFVARNREVVGTYFSTPLPKGDFASVSLDIRDRKAVIGLIDRFNPTAVVHCAGSDRDDDMQDVIVAGTEHLVVALQASGTRLIHISTDVVFDGNDGPYSEADEPHPLHAYGLAKTAADAIATRHENCAILRPSLIYDLDEIDHSTLGMSTRILAGETISLFTNELRCPVWRQTLSEACVELVESDFRGIVHMGGGEAVSRAEYAKLLLSWWNVDWEDRVVDVVSDSPDRPLDCRLDNSLARGLLKVPMKGVRQVISEADTA